MKNRVLIVIILGISQVLINVFLRPYIFKTTPNPVLLTIFGSLPMFTFIIGLVLILRTLKIFNNLNSIIFGVTFGMLFREMGSFYNTMSSGEGNTFDYSDIIATLIGAITVYFIEKKYFVFLEKKVSIK